MRAGALPSPANQARVLSGVVAAAKQEGWKVNLIEAFDQPWKRLLEGTVGGYWGFTATAPSSRNSVSAQPCRTSRNGGSRRGSASARPSRVLLSGLARAARPRARPRRGARDLGGWRHRARPRPRVRLGRRQPADGRREQGDRLRALACSCSRSWCRWPRLTRSRAATGSPALPRRSIRRIGARKTRRRGAGGAARRHHGRRHACGARARVRPALQGLPLRRAHGPRHRACASSPSPTRARPSRPERPRSSARSC